ncbi:MAG: hypothetical protein LBS95_00905 [Mycoplasmataceae bacterium]|jgi:hypothetical protein|nr:hypothetical protein [Mycoplasmataceae bacterium]
MIHFNLNNIKQIDLYDYYQNQKLFNFLNAENELIKVKQTEEILKHDELYQILLKDEISSDKSIEMINEEV